MLSLGLEPGWPTNSLSYGGTPCHTLVQPKSSQSNKHTTLESYYGQFFIRYDSRVVNYDHRDLLLVWSYLKILFNLSLPNKRHRFICSPLIISQVYPHLHPITWVKVHLPILL